MNINTEPIVAGESFSVIKDNINNNFAEIETELRDVNNQIADSIVFGTYVGNGEESRDIVVFESTPVAVEVWRQDGCPNRTDVSNGSSYIIYNGIALKDYPYKNYHYTFIEIIPNGFRVYEKSNSNTSSYSASYMNEKDDVYCYKAYMNGTIKD